MMTQMDVDLSQQRWTREAVQLSQPRLHSAGAALGKGPWAGAPLKNETGEKAVVAVLDWRLP